MNIIDLYRKGVKIGYTDARNRKRRKAVWEILLSHLYIFIPIFDKKSFIHGYYNGYNMGLGQNSLSDRRI